MVKKEDVLNLENATSFFFFHRVVLLIKPHFLFEFTIVFSALLSQSRGHINMTFCWYKEVAK